MVTNLLIDTYGIETRVHDVNPAVFGRKDKERHEGLPQVVKVVFAVDPDVTRVCVQAIGAVLDVADVRTVAVVEAAFEQLYAQDAENDEKGTTNQDNVADGFQR